MNVGRREINIIPSLSFSPLVPTESPSLLSMLFSLPHVINFTTFVLYLSPLPRCCRIFASPSPSRKKLPQEDKKSPPLGRHLLPSLRQKILCILSFFRRDLRYFVGLSVNITLPPFVFIVHGACFHPPVRGCFCLIRYAIGISFRPITPSLRSGPNSNPK